MHSLVSSMELCPIRMQLRQYAGIHLNKKYIRHNSIELCPIRMQLRQLKN